MTKPRVLVATSDWVGKQMAGPGIRAFNLAHQLATRGFDVTLAAPNQIDVAVDGVTTVRLGAYDSRATIALARSYDAVVAQRLPARAMVSLADSPTRVVYDLYDPPLQSAMAAKRHRVHEARARLVTETALLAGDAFICASERQRDFWLGALATLGRLDGNEHKRDASLRQLIDVVPFGIDVNPPAAAAPAMRGVLTGVDERSQVLLWGGGLWGWLDPVTVIEAVYELSRERGDLRLVFMGVRRPNTRAAEKSATARAVAAARELGLLDSVVIFNAGWVPYEKRGAWLAEADIGVSAHFDTFETRFSFRTRVLDYLWAGLPVVTTGGDVLGELVERERLGACIAPRDVARWVAALGHLLDDESARQAATERVNDVRPLFEWPRVVESLARLVLEPGRHVELPRRTRTAGPRESYLRGRTLLTRGGADAMRTYLTQRLRQRAR